MGTDRLKSFLGWQSYDNLSLSSCFASRGTKQWYNNKIYFASRVRRIWSSDKLFRILGHFSNPPKKSCSNFFWVAQDLILVQLILIMQKITKKSLFGHFLGYPPKMHYSALQCSAIYWSANTWIIHSRGILVKLVTHQFWTPIFNISYSQYHYDIFDTILYQQTWKK